MLSSLWTSTGRGYAHLRTALLSFSGTTGTEGPLRLAWAATLVDVCEHSGEEKAAELVHAVHECLTAQNAPEVNAAGLECVAALCESDALDFYKAWAVVRPLFPSLPQHPAAAAAWLRLLACGGLDADVHPEVARGVVDALWAATANPQTEVRHQAYDSLAAFDMNLLESIDAMGPLSEYASLLQQEPDTQALQVCEALVGMALKREHATRRRLVASERSAPRRRQQMLHQGAGMAHRLAISLPKALMASIGSGAAHPRDLLSVPAAAVLFFWAPPAPASKGTASASANRAAAEYAAVFQEVCQHPDGLMVSSVGSVATARVAAWASFLKRWRAAERAAGARSGGGTASQDESNRSIAAIWGSISPLLNDNNVAVACNATWATAALCTLSTNPAKNVVTAVHAALVKAARGEQCAAAVQPSAAAAAALGHCTGVVRTVVGFGAVQASMALLASNLHNSECPVSMCAACAWGLGLACKQLARSATSGDVRTLVLDAFGGLLSLVLASSSAADDASRQQLRNALGSGRMISLEQQHAVPVEVLQACLQAIADATPTAVGLGLPSLVDGLHSMAYKMVIRLQAGADAACALLGATALAAFQCKVIGDAELGSAMQLLFDVVKGRVSCADASSPDGNLMGAAASALGTLLCEAAQQGCSFNAASSTPQTCVEGFLNVLAEARACTHVAHLKVGVASGLAAVLRGAVASSPSAPLAAISPQVIKGAGEAKNNNNSTCSLRLIFFWLF